jgi:hypothetical protein
MVERQKQKQTVIVNIGDKIVKRKRKRKPRKKAGPSAPQYPPPAPPPSQDFARVIYQAQAMKPQDNLAVQLNAVTKQLQELEEKQKHRTGNLMAAQQAIAREEGAQGFVGQTQTDEPQMQSDETQTMTDEETQLERFIELAQIAEATAKADIRGRDRRARSQPPVAIPFTPVSGFQPPQAQARFLEETQRVRDVVQLGGGGGGEMAAEPPAPKKQIVSRGGGGGGAAEQPEDPLITKPRKKKGPGRPSKESLAAEAAKQKDVTSFFTK